MLVSEIVSVKWNAKTKTHYVNLGYSFTKMGDSFEVRVQDLTKASTSIITVQCDYCGELYYPTWHTYKFCKERNIAQKDCCGNPSCTGKKAQESIQTKYNVRSIRELDFVNDKIKQTNIERYGCENPFGNEIVQEKIKQYYKENYGVTHNMQLPECVIKSKETCVKRYGVESYTQTAEYRESVRGENSPVWKGDKVKNPRSERNLPEYHDWRKAVFGRDKYTCQCCGARNGCGTYIRLEAHHIRNWKDNVELRHEIENGLTLCAKCHISFHAKYGKRNNTPEQLEEFITNQNNIDEKIC